MTSVIYGPGLGSEAAPYAGRDADGAELSVSLRSRLRRARPPLPPLRIFTESGLPCRVPKEAPPSIGLPEDAREAFRRCVDTASPAFVVAQAAVLARRGRALRGDGAAGEDDESPIPGNGNGSMGDVAAISMGPEARRLARFALPVGKSSAAPQLPAGPGESTRGRELAPPSSEPPLAIGSAPRLALPAALTPAADTNDVGGPWSAASDRVRQQLICPTCAEPGHIEMLDLVTGRLDLSCGECGTSWERSDGAADSVGGSRSDRSLPGRSRG